MRCLSKTKGFTIVEVLVVIPIVILIIGVIVGFIVSLTGSALMSNQRGGSAFQTQDALDRIEQDIRLANEFLSTTTDIPAPQGVNSTFTGSAQFTDSTKYLMIRQSATTDNPYNTSRSLVHYKDAPHPCGINEKSNPTLQITVVYFVHNNSLVRRVIVPDYNTAPENQTCATAWQKNTCDTSVLSNARCNVRDEVLVKDIVTGIELTYYAKPGDTAAIADASAAATATVKILTSKKTAGQDIAHSGRIRATKLNVPQEKLTAPTAPTLQATLTGPDVLRIAWNPDRVAATHDVKYSVNNSSCNKTAATNTTLTYQYLVGDLHGINHEDQIYVCVTSKNLAGSSPVATYNTTIPLWASVPYEGDWQNYSSSWMGLRFTRLSSGEVKLGGLMKSPSNSNHSVIAVLPERYRPTKRLLFTVYGRQASSSVTDEVNDYNSRARVDISPNGDITFNSGQSSSYVSLDNINFMAAQSWTNGECPEHISRIMTASKWQNYGSGASPFQNARACRDSWNRVHTEGLMTVPTRSDFVRNSWMAANDSPNYNPGIARYLLPSTDGLHGSFAIYPYTWNQTDPRGLVLARGYYYSWISINSNYPHASHVPWHTLPMSNGWVNYSSTAPSVSSPGWNHLQYTKKGRVVTIRGLIKNGTIPSSTVGVLPAGYRPSNRMIFAVQIQTGSLAGERIGRLDILPDGTMTFFYMRGNAWASLDALSFIAEN